MKFRFKKLTKKVWTTLAFLVFTQIILVAQSLQHPHIWVSDSDKQEILNNIEKYDWASSFYSQLKNRVDAKKNTHKTNPSAILKTISAIPGSSSARSSHNNMLTSASEAAILYYLTDDEDYAQYAADILSHYTDRLALLPAQKYKNSSTGLFFSDWWLESRALYPKIAIIYDFVYNYINDPAHTVFDLATNSRKNFNNTAGQKTVETLAIVVFKSIGARKSNHSVLAGNGALFNTLMIDDDAKREEFFNRFYNDPLNDPFDAYTWTLNNFTSQNIWDETFGYSKGSHAKVLQSLDVIDRYKPELDIINKNIGLLDGYYFYENYYYPSGGIMRFGDTNPEEDILDGYERIAKIAKRKNLSEYLAKTKQTLKYEYDKRGGHKTKVETQNLEWSNPLVLLWGIEVEDSITVTPPKFEGTVPVEHAGLVIQRNYFTPDVKNDGFMYYSGGATYVHTHRTGIDLELYGKGYVLGAESGSGSYGSDDHEHYRTQLASHNTVIVNGSGKSGSNWDSKMSDVKLIACEPKVKEEAISTKFSFSTQYINDTYNSCIQQRTNSIVRTGPSSGYYFDIFRSKGKMVNRYHDYIYHNIGDRVTLNFDDNSVIPLSSSTKYSNDISGSLTGWKFFQSVKSSSSTNKAVKGTFALNTYKTYMNVIMPGGVDFEYATAIAPSTKGARTGYDKKNTPVITMRKIGEAWDKPFIAVYEPFKGSGNTVQSVESIEIEGKIIGAVVTSNVDGKEFKDFIISNDKVDSVYIPEHFISFKGRFGIVRKEKQTDTTENVTLYIGNGEKLTYAELELVAGDDMKNVKTFSGVNKLTSETRYKVNNQVNGVGGVISRSPDQVNYVAGSQVVLNANPSPGYVFDGWSGDISSNENPLTLNVDANMNVTANFKLISYYKVDLLATHGTATKSPDLDEYEDGTSVSLTAIPDSGYVFNCWSGDISGTSEAISIVLDGDKNITANFNLISTLIHNNKLVYNILVYPNPSQAGVFNINHQKVWLVRDLYGRNVKSGFGKVVDLTAFPQGVYFLTINDETIKLLKSVCP